MPLSELVNTCEIKKQNKDQAIDILSLVAEVPELFNHIILNSRCDHCKEFIAIGNNIRGIARNANAGLTICNKY
jgi:hypothetical protein